jgi:hypothetical protein
VLPTGTLFKKEEEDGDAVMLEVKEEGEEEMM